MLENPQVTEYYQHAPEKFQGILWHLRSVIFEATANESELSEIFSYRIAVYRYGKKPLFSVAYFKDHCSFISQDKNISEAIPKLKDYPISGTSIHFTNEKPLSDALVRKIIAKRLKDRKQAA